MKKSISQIKEFHEKFGIPVGTDIKIPTKAEQDLHYKLLAEELEEFKEACDKDDIVGIADGLGDLLFVLLSSVVSHGLHGCIVEVFNEICASNMSKLGEDGKPVYREDGKIMRGKDYFPPKLKAIIDKHLEQNSIKDQIQNI